MLSLPLRAQEGGAYRVKSSGESANSAPGAAPAPSAISIPSLLERAASQMPSVPLPDYRVVEKALPEKAKPDFINHQIFKSILAKYVSKTGWVNYSGLSRDPRAREKLSAYIRDLSEINPSSLEDPRDRMASWLNLYNALVLQEILKSYPVDSLRKIRNLLTAKRIIVGGKEYSILELEDEIFRQELKDPRAVFARVSGSSSGPRLLKEPFEAERIDEQLEERVWSFLADPANLQYDKRRKTLILSGLFAVYEKEFPDLAAFLSVYLRLPSERYQIAYRSYDFRLNDVKLH